MKKKKIIVCLLAMLLMFFISIINVDAKEDNSEIMGIYTISAPVKAPKKVYVQEQLVDYLKEEDIYQS